MDHILRYGHISCVFVITDTAPFRCVNKRNLVFNFVYAGIATVVIFLTCTSAIVLIQK